LGSCGEDNWCIGLLILSRSVLVHSILSAMQRALDEDCHVKLLYEACQMEKRNEMKDMVDGQAGHLLKDANLRHAVNWTPLVEPADASPRTHLQQVGG